VRCTDIEIFALFFLHHFPKHRIYTMGFFSICSLHIQVTNDIFTKEDGEFLIKHGALPEERIRAVETGGCPHAAIREDISINLGPLEELSNLYKADLLLCESGGGIFFTGSKLSLGHSYCYGYICINLWCVFYWIQTKFRSFLLSWIYPCKRTYPSKCYFRVMLVSTGIQGQSFAEANIGHGLPPFLQTPLNVHTLSAS